MASNTEDLVQLEDLQEGIPVKNEPQECVVCITESSETFDIYATTTTASKTLLYKFLQKITNSELPHNKEFAKYVCKICFNLINELENAEIEYNKLKDAFKCIISKNPLFSLMPSEIEEQVVKNVPESSQTAVTIKKEVTDDGGPSKNFNTVVKLEPLSDEDASTKEYEIQYTPTKWGTVLVSRKGDELITERPDWVKLIPGGGDAVDKQTKEVPPAIKTRKKPEKIEVEIPANTIILENGEKVFECKVCQRQFKQKGNYNRHVITHTGVMPFECTTCQRRFKRKDHLHNHIRTHTGEKPFECNFCLLKFNQKGSIIKHIRTHTGQEPYQCNVCKKRFKQRPHLNSHVRIHTGEKPYECKVCQRRFIESSKLKIHARTHTGEKPYKCTYCSRRFNQTGNLQSHLRTHTGEKPYECTVCHRRFNLKHHLRDHFSVHTGDKPYHCTVCKQRFNYKHVLQNHQRVMHPPEVMHELYPDDDTEHNFEVSVDSEASLNSESNFDDGNTEVNSDDGNSKRTFEVSVNSEENSSEETINDKPTVVVTVEPTIEVSVKAEPVDYNDTD